jgi:hypothetical protein
MIGRIAQHLANPVDALLQPEFVVDRYIPGPQPLSKLVSSDELAGAFQQRPQHLERLRTQLLPQTRPAQLRFLQIGFEHAEPDDTAWVGRHRHKPSIEREQSLSHPGLERCRASNQRDQMCLPQQFAR